MHAGPKLEPRLIVWISCHAPNAFGWEIRRGADSTEVHRSERLFANRIDALFDSAATAESLAADIELSFPDANRKRG